MSAAGRCRAGDCDRPVKADGLCRLHWERRRRGAPIGDPAQIGDPPHGTWGEVTVLADGRLLCHECGRGWKNLGSHVARSHEMTPREYKIAYGLPVTRGLVADELRERMRDHLADVPEMTDHLPPAGAAVGSQDWGVHRQSARLRDKTPSARAARAALSTPDERVCPRCGAQWCPMPGSDKKRAGTRGCGSDGCPSRQMMKSALMTPSERAARNRRIIDLSQSLSRREVAARFGLTPEAVGKIVRDAPRS